MNTPSTAPSAAVRPAAGYPIEIDPRLVEDSVLLAIEREPVAARRRFRRRRDRIYEIEPAERRESAFNELSRQWFVRLGLAAPVRQALAREPDVAAGTARCLVVPVVRARQEYADLEPARRGDGPPTLLLRLRVSTMVDGGGLARWLGHELTHVADMLDPEFAFEPELPTLDGSAALDGLLRQRYQTLWDTTIDGRLAARGELPAAAAAGRLQEFLGVFSMLGESGEWWFERFFSGARPSHAELVAFACGPGQPGAGSAHNRCPVCHMPTVALHPDPTGLADGTVSAIQQDLPDWTPAHGLCRQCADLYAATPSA